MTARAYYNEIDPYAAQWLRNLISAGHIAPGDVDERSIVDVHPDDLIGYDQCHFFAGIGGWSLASRLAGWPDERPLWTGSCPCQPFSTAGKTLGIRDERHLWPAFFGLIRASKPAVVMGEQVAAAIGQHWLDGVHSDLEGICYTVRAAVVPACAVDAPHKRDRLWFVADSDCSEPRPIDGDAGEMRGISKTQCQPELGPSLPDGGCSARRDNVADPDSEGGCKRDDRTVSHSPSRDLGATSDEGDGNSFGHPRTSRRNFTAWSEHGWVVGADGKARRVEPGVRLLADGVPARMAKLRALGNAVVPQVAAEVIGAYMDATGTSGTPNGEQQHG